VIDENRAIVEAEKEVGKVLVVVRAAGQTLDVVGQVVSEVADRPAAEGEILVALGSELGQKGPQNLEGIATR